jgi:hypothetical protein
VEVGCLILPRRDDGRCFHILLVAQPVAMSSIPEVIEIAFILLRTLATKIILAYSRACLKDISLFLKLPAGQEWISKTKKSIARPEN